MDINNILLSSFKKIKGFLVIFFIALLVLLILKITKNSNNLNEESTQPVFVDTTNIDLGNHKPEYIFYGNIRGVNYIDVIAKLSGKITFVSPKVKNSSYFKENEIVFQLDDFRYKQEVIQKKATLNDLENELKSTNLKYAEVLKQLNLNQKDYERKSKLYGSIITKKELEDSELTLSMTKARMLDEKARLNSLLSNIEIAKARLKTARRDLNDTKYKAPFDGKVSNNLIEIGTEVITGKVLGSLINTNSLNVDFFVGENTYTTLGKFINKDVNVIWKNSKYKNKYKGKIFYVDGSINKERSGLNIKAKLENIDNDDPIKPGVFVEVLLLGDSIENSFLVEENAIYDDNFVLILKNQIPIKRKIYINGTVKNKIIITGNIKKGEKLILTRLNSINGKQKLLSKSKNEK
ncbi:MAG: hypothetical protein CMP40_02785 [Rickettsiales bacterium]|nr:hypothetical protein [Rickettsiales bacterium]|tara:strand:- start:391 stop:1611 length:1221 start_codon:yes stop_codon:yes gene_type:complete